MTVQAPEMINFTQSINLALHDAMAADERVFLLGEDIADEEGGGVMKATARLSTKFGTARVRSTPIAEAAIAGAAVGAAQAGLIPVAEIMIMGFIGLALDALHNTAAKWRYLTGGVQSVPLTVRTRAGGGGGQHGDMLEGWFIQSPGLKVVMPSNPADCYGLLMACIFDPDPCIFVEHGRLMARVVRRASRPAPGTQIPIGVASIARTGKDVTVVSYGGQVVDALEAADKLAGEGIDVEVVDLRTILPLDANTVLRSVAKTKRAVIVHQARTTYGPGAEIATQIYEELSGDLAAPIQRVGAPFCSVPGTMGLERAYTPNANDVEMAIRRTLA